MGAGQRAAVAVAVEVAIAAVLQTGQRQQPCKLLTVKKIAAAIRRSVQDVLIPEAEQGSK